MACVTWARRRNGTEDLSDMDGKQVCMSLRRACVEPGQGIKRSEESGCHLGASQISELPICKCL